MTCQCSTPGYCPTLSREMPSRLHQLCQTRRDYRQLFRRQAGSPDEDAGIVLPQEPFCVHRGPMLGQITTPVGSLPVLTCYHPDHRETTLPACEACSDRTTQANRQASPIERYLPIVGKGERIRSWGVGIVTAPRSEPTLGRCLDSMICAGWHPRIFAEPDSPIPDYYPADRITQRPHRFNAWENWHHALRELVEEFPAADAYMVAQDDVIFWSPSDAAEQGSCCLESEAIADSRRRSHSVAIKMNLREYLEAALWPEESPGFVSLYTSAKYHLPEYGWHTLAETGNPKWVWGACAIVWPAESLRHFLATTAVEWSRQKREKKVDIAAGIWQQKYKRSAWFCCPSLAQHIGHTSTIWGPNNTATGRRAAQEYAGDVVR